jgi:hypothetical protein
MKKIAGAIIFILLAITMVTNAEEGAVSPFVGTWGGQWADDTGFTKQRFVGSFTLAGDGKGGVILESWITIGGKNLNLKNPPKIEQSSPNEILILWPNGNRTYMKLEGSTLRAEQKPVSGRPWTGTFFREKEKQ